MSKIGKSAIEFPSNVKVEVNKNEDNLMVISIKGPRGEMERTCHNGISFELNGNVLKVIQGIENKKSKAIHGLERALVANMVKGVSEGFSKTLQMSGTGYKVFHKGDFLDLKLMKSHPVNFYIPKGVDVKVEGTTIMHVSGNDKQAVGQTAVNISRLLKKDPYKGKGIHIKGEFIRRKAGKNKKK